MHLITLTTDFGMKDPFAGMMKGVIHSINEHVNVIDITHGIGSQDIFTAAFVISNSFNYFPKKTIHLVVVDPGVGTGRRPILVRASNHYFIGPDNGVLSLVTAADANAVTYEVTEERYFLRSVGNTFHGRDIFAPVAGWLSKGCEPDNFGFVISDPVSINIPQPVIEKGILQGEIIYIDRFGNLFTNITFMDIAKHTHAIYEPGLAVTFNDMNLSLKRYYAEARSGEIAAVINSFSLLEIYSYMDNAEEKLNARKGDPVSLCLK